MQIFLSRYQWVAYSSKEVMSSTRRGYSCYKCCYSPWGWMQRCYECRYDIYTTNAALRGYWILMNVVRMVMSSINGLWALRGYWMQLFLSRYQWVAYRLDMNNGYWLVLYMNNGLWVSYDIYVATRLWLYTRLWSSTRLLNADIPIRARYQRMNVAYQLYYKCCLEKNRYIAIKAQSQLITWEW